MDRVTIDEQILYDIADAIRTKYEGGGGEGGIDLPYDIDCGSITPMADTTLEEFGAIEHSLGKEPYIVFMWNDDTSNYPHNANYKIIHSVIYRSNGSVNCSSCYRAWANASQSPVIGDSTMLTEDTFTIKTSSVMQLLADNTYSWIALAKKGE